MTLRWKLLLPLLVASLLMVAALHRLWLTPALERIETTEVESVRRHLDSVAEGLVPLVMSMQLDVIRENLDSVLAKNPDWVSLTLKDLQGRQLYPPRLDDRGAAIRLPQDPRQVTLDVRYLGRNLGHLHAVIDLGPHMESQRQGYLRINLLVLTMLLGAMAMLWIVVDRAIHRPLRRLSAAAATLARHDYATPLPEAGRDEVGSLVRSFASMREEIQARHRELTREIEEKRLAEASLRQLSQVVEQSPESIIITDRDAHIEYVNEAFLRCTGYVREEVIGFNPRLLKSGQTPSETFVSLWATLTRGETWQGEFINRRKDGSTYVDFAQVLPLRQPDGQISHYVAVLENITEKKRMAEELDRHRQHLQEMVAQRTAELTAARREAEAANLAKSAFLANLGHTLQAPLGHVLGQTQLLRQTALTTRQAEQLDKLLDTGKHMEGLLNDLLDMSNIDAGRLQLESVPLHLPALLEQVAAAIRPMALAKNLRLDVACEEFPADYLGDPARLRQALGNYAANAAKYTDRGTVSLRAQLLEDGMDDSLIRFEVVDTGPGILPEHRSGIFSLQEPTGHPAWQRTQGDGLGLALGLAVTQRLAGLMEGKVGVESTPGVGSTFWFTARLKKAGR